ncbi:MAG TPA: DUF4388 domain-containing protein [Myxococcaceae bacterium]|nr:DUF4388 domain-containing protein [Myxococcaceae bacterium]
MALQGTLKDFGIGDILQLIGQQQKTGVLLLKARDQEVQVFFNDGAIVRTESSTRRKKDLIGTMLVRAELITEVQLQQALEQQKRTLERLGDVLVGMDLISASRFRHMVQLQVNETLYGLFLWKSGTYHFEQREVEFDPQALSPLRAESVLMEGFRRVDEWPLIRKSISSDDITFEKKQELPQATAEEADPFGGLDAAFDALDGGDEGESGGELSALGANERAVFAKITPRRTVRELVDVSLLGEFETYKALYNLVTLGYLEAKQGSGRRRATGGASMRRVFTGMARVAMTVAMGTLIAVLGVEAASDSSAFRRSRASFFVDTAAERHISLAQQARIRAALEVYRVERGVLPESLQHLVEAGLLEEEDLHYPWTDRYHYRRSGEQAFVLLPPLR